MSTRKRRVLYFLLAIAALLVFGIAFAPTSQYRFGAQGGTGTPPPATVVLALHASVPLPLPRHAPPEDFGTLAFLDVPVIAGSTGNSAGLPGLTGDNPFANGPWRFNFRDGLPDDWMRWAMRDLSSVNALGLRVPTGSGGGGGSGGPGGGSGSAGGGGGSGGDGGNGDGGRTPNPEWPNQPPAVVPLPPTVWLLATSLLGLLGLSRRKRPAHAASGQLAH